MSNIFVRVEDMAILFFPRIPLGSKIPVLPQIPLIPGGITGVLPWVAQAPRFLTPPTSLSSYLFALAPTLPAPIPSFTTLRV